MRWLGIFSTATDCSSESFVWSNKSLYVIPISNTSTIHSFEAIASVGDCAVSYGLATTEDDSPLPNYIVHDVNTKTLKVTVDSKTKSGFITIKIVAYLNDGISEFRTSTNLITFEMRASNNLPFFNPSLQSSV